MSANKNRVQVRLWINKYQKQRLEELDETHEGIAVHVRIAIGNYLRWVTQSRRRALARARRKTQ